MYYNIKHDVLNGDYKIINSDIIWIHGKEGLNIFIDDRYELIRELARGGTSVVYLVKHIGLDSLRVIKRIEKNPINISSYFVEVNILRDASIKGIPLIYDVEEDNEYLYIVEEYIQGENFFEYITDMRRTKVELIRCIMELCDIITGIHSLKPNPVIYNDLKSENILIKEGKVYLIDFGNCRVLGNKFDNNRASVSNVTPEHFKVMEPDITTDVYGIGVLIQNIYQLHKDMFEEDRDIFNDIISGALERDIVKRIATPDIIKKYLSRCTVNNDIDKVDCDKSTKGIKVYVYGCREYAGVTHFSIGLTRFLSELRKKCVYIETQNSRGFTRYLDNSVVRRHGIIKYEKCKIWPYYGDFIKEHTDISECIHIYDGGVYKGENITDGIVIVVITDMKSFGELMYEHNSGTNVLYVVNFSDELGFKRFGRKTGMIAVKMPYFPNPLKLNNDSKVFYKKILNIILKNQGCTK